MPSTTHSEFSVNTEAREVAQAFADRVRGKTILVTGVNRAGLGYYAADAFASQSPARLIVAGRSPERLQNSIDALQAEFPAVEYRPLKVDLSSQQSVRAAAAEVLAWADVPAIDIVVNSAGVMLLPKRTLSVDGIEMHMATNHVGHFLLTNLIMPKLLAASAGDKTAKGDTRVVNVSSASPLSSRIRWSDHNFETINKELPQNEQPDYAMFDLWAIENARNLAYVPLEGYNQSKVANVLFGIGVTRHLYAQHGIVGISVHPGVIPTELGRNASPEVLERVREMVENGIVVYKTLGAGAATAVVAALDPKLGQDVGQAKGDVENYGAFMEDCQISETAAPQAVSSAEADRLWAWSEELVKETFPWKSQ